MKVLLLTHGTHLQPDRIASGNSVRAYYLANGLIRHGIKVTHVYPRALEVAKSKVPPSGVALHSFDNKTELAQLIQWEKPDVLLVGYWELLEQLPDGLPMPLVLDVVAPRILEAMYQEDRRLDDEIQRMLALYRKADRFLVGNERQRHFLLPWLIMAGFDCREEIPIDIIPISTLPGKPLSLEPNKKKWRFVSGGVVWPWRRTEAYFDALVRAIQDVPGIQGKLILFSGKYVYEANKDLPALTVREASWPPDIVHRQPLQPYGEMENFLSRHCDIGLETADRNTEREYSQSFRAVEFLRCGLPVICNDYLELADEIRKYDAGWVIHSPEDLPEVLQAVVASPDEWAVKSANAIRLVDEAFNYLKTIRPLVDFINQPSRPRRGRQLLSPNRVESIPPPAIETGSRRQRDRVKSVLLGNLRRGLSRWRQRSDFKTIAIISRADIFPTDHGAAVKIERTAWGLSHFVDAVYLITDDRRHYYVYQNGNFSERRYPRWLSIMATPRWMVRNSLKRRGVPVSDAFLYYPLQDWSYIVRTLYLAWKHSIGVFQAEFPAYARACLWGRSLFGGKTLLVEHNIEYQRLREQFPELTAQAYDFLRQMELTLCHQVDAVVVVSEQDQNRLVEEGVDYRHIHYIPHGVDLEEFDRKTPIDLAKTFAIPLDQPILVYHGIYLYPPNLEALEVMAREILPRLHGQHVYPKVLAVGRHPPQRSLHEDIVFTGPVDSIAPYLLAADVAVVPLLRGGGTRMKVLDYFAARLPVVSTSKGVEGIPVENGKHIIIEDDYDRFAAAIVELLQNSKKAQQIASQARAFVEPLGWKAIAQRYLQLMI